MENDHDFGELMAKLTDTALALHRLVHRSEKDLTSLEDSFDALVKRVVLLEQNWE